MIFLEKIFGNRIFRMIRGELMATNLSAQEDKTTEESASAQGTERSKRRRKSDLVALIIMIVLSVILIPVLAINLTLIIKSSVRQDVPPDVFGVAPLAVTSGSMDGGREDGFEKGALIFVRLLDDEDKQSLKEGEIVTFRASDNVYVTHRIVGINRDDAGQIVSVVTKGDANASSDGAILLSDVVGICTGSAAGLGDFSIFLQTPVGILVFIGIPVLLFIVYDVIRITLYNRRVRAEAESADSEAVLDAKQTELEQARSELRAREEELARLRAQVQASQETRAQETGKTPSADAGTVGDSSVRSDAENSDGEN